MGFQVSPLAKLPTAQIGDLRRGTWRGSLLPRPPACQNLFCQAEASRVIPDWLQTVKKPPESSRGPQPFRPGSARLHLLPLFHKKGSANIQRGHGTVFASENPIFQRKKRFLAGSALEKSSIFSGDWRGWQWRGSLLPRPPACHNFFDKLRCLS